MSNPAPPASSDSGPKEKTFTSYTPSQASTYASSRSGYHPTFYNFILAHHAATGGSLHTLLDVGCGPGIVVSTLAPHFEHAFGLDASEGMITTARSIGGTTGSGEAIKFVVSTAEELQGVEAGSVDLLVAATAAHWFDMPRFWKAAGRVLAPGGTVALWTAGNGKLRDDLVPNGAAVQASLNEIMEVELRPFYEEGNWIARNLYVDLPLPWDVGAEDFEREQGYLRKEFGIGNDEDEVKYTARSATEMSLDAMEKMMGTMSQVHRWRDANPDKTGEQDVLRRMRREVERLLREAGVTDPDKMVLRGKYTAVLIMVKKKKAVE